MTAAPRLLLAVWLVVLPAAAAGDKRMVIEGVDRYRVMDPLFECVRVVLSHRGEKLAPAYIQGISGAAFRIGGPCPCAPTCTFAMETQELVELLGYEAKHVDLVGKEKDAREVRKVVDRVKAEIRAGRPTPVWHAFTNAEWDVVCGFDEARKQFLGRGSYAGLDGYASADETRTAKCTDICPALGVILIGQKTGKFRARQAELAALEEAVRHAHSPRDRFLAELPDRRPEWRFRNGLAAYEWWIRDFRLQPDKVPNSGDRYCLGVYMSTHRAAAGFLRELAAKYPEAKAHLEGAAGHFAAEADALDECRKLNGMNWGSKAQRDPKRNARVAELFTQARRAYARGIDEIDRALKKLDPDRAKAARGPRPRRRKDGRVWIAGVRKLKFGQRHCTFAGAVEEALRATPHPYLYHEIMGLTGLAFRVRWCNEDTKTKWCPSAAIGEMPDEQAAAAERTGWALPVEWIDAKKRDVGKLRARIVAQIDKGRPVITYPDNWNMAVIYGYEDGGKMLLVNDCMKDEMPSKLPVEKLGPMQIWVGRYRKPPSLPDTLRGALQTAVRNWRRKRHHGGLTDREYWYGDAAFAAWTRDLGNFDKLPPKAQEGLRGLDPWNYLCLHDARKAAAAFLKEWAVVLDGDPRKALDRARALYEKETQLLAPLLAPKRAAKIDWSKAARAREIEILTQARALEAAAIAEIEKALD